MSEDEFVDAVTQGQSVAPLYFAFAANRNRQRRDLLAEDTSVPALSFDDVLARQQAGAVVLDARDHEAFAAGHLRGSINVGLGGRFAEYAGEVIRPDTAIVLVTPARARVRGQGAPGTHRLRRRRRSARPADRDTSSLIPSTSIACSRLTADTLERTRSPSCPSSC